MASTAIPAPKQSKYGQWVSPAAYGVHHRINKKLCDFFETTAGHSSFYFYEYLLERPVTCWDDFALEEIRKQSITAPFLRLFAYQTGFMPAVTKEEVQSFAASPSAERQIKSVPLTNSNIRTFWGNIDQAELDVTLGDVLSSLMRYWREDKADMPEVADFDRREHIDGIASLIGTASTADLRKLLDVYAQIYKDDANSWPLVALQLREYDLVLRPWLQSGDLKHIGVAAFSISTKAVFWGECLVVFPLEDPDQLKSHPKLASGISELLRMEITTVYAPMLCLLENSIYEDELKRLLADAPATPLPSVRGVTPELLRDYGPYFKLLASEATDDKPGPMPGKPKEFVQHIFARLSLQLYEDPKLFRSRLNHLEWALVELWADRFAYFDEPNSDRLKKSLVFAKYLVASPSMVRCTAKAMSLRHKEDDKPRAVRSALVVGGPGSGKDAMAQLISLFSPGFRLSESATLNMAMFRPKEAAVPLLLGLATEIDGTEYNVVGLLEKIVKAHNKKLLASVSPQRRGLTFILDELNSLDIDTQGALLRVLENAELQPLGAVSASSEQMDLLIIGVMNEDPQMIMKRRAMDRVLQQHDMFGAILGESLHEMLRRQRRLRDDLYYRLIRGGEIVLPDLKDRREDIPILFYFYVDTEYSNLMPAKVRDNWQVELPVYEALTDVELSWEGNLRELQTISRKIVTEAVADFESQGNPDESLLIKGVHARRALADRRSDRTLVPP